MIETKRRAGIFCAAFLHKRDSRNRRNIHEHFDRDRSVRVKRKLLCRIRSGIAAGVLSATRQTGSVLGVALFGSLIGQASAFMTGIHEALVISAGLLLVAAAAIWRGAST
jgi:hypothetical protein